MTTNTKTAEELDAIRAQILQDPYLILDDGDLMRALIEANGARVGRKVVDLRGVLVDRLEDRLGRLEETHRSVIAAAYENLAGTNQIHRAILAVLECAKLSDFLAVLGRDVPNMLAVDTLRVCLESASGAAKPGQVNEVLIQLPAGSSEKYLDLDRPSSHRQVVLRPCIEGVDTVFGPDAGRIRSEAIIQLDLGVPEPGLLVFGAEDPHRFSPDQAGDLLAFFGGVVERAMRRWLS
jgi:uncharacterized protein YigA (DUF484 family)